MFFKQVFFRRTCPCFGPFVLKVGDPIPEQVFCLIITQKLKNKKHKMAQKMIDLRKAVEEASKEVQVTICKCSQPRVLLAVSLGKNVNA